jgi:hypothetical protein
MQDTRIKVKDLNLWTKDPLLRFFKDKLGFSDLRIVLFFVGFSAFVEFGLGWIADLSYTGSGVRFADQRYYFFALAYTFAFTPLFIGSYVWQPRGLVGVFDSFERADILRTISNRGIGKVKSYKDFLAEFQVVIDKRRWVVVSITMIILFWIVEFVVTWPMEFATTGGIPFWYEAKWLLFARLLNLSFGLYALSMIILRQIQAIIYFNKLFRWFDIRIHPMHPDNAGGLGALGDFTVKASLIVVGIGFAASAFSILTGMLSVSPFIRPDILVFWALYIVLTPLSLLLPMLSAHDAMREFKNERLVEISEEFEYTLSNSNVVEYSDGEDIKKENEKLAELETRYSIVARSFPTWPISTQLFRNFSITASLPLLSGAVSLVIDFVT